MAALFAVCLAFGLGACGEKEDLAPETQTSSSSSSSKSLAQGDSASSAAENAAFSHYHPDIPANYVGSQSCQECHAQEVTDWHTSDHFKSMMEVSDETVLGDFDNASFEHFGHQSTFFRKGEEYWVRTEGPNGQQQEYKIEYTFGFYPLQQYLIAFPGGRLQAFQVCWDSRPAEQGGQRWYHLYPDEAIPSTDVLHWTKEQFNWNYMCADCHSTDLKKNYDVATQTYDTTWSEINVSCEACHGPGSEHVKWAKESQQPDYTKVAEYMESKGLLVTLKEPVDAVWNIDPATQMPKRYPPLESHVQVDACARCHSHRQLLQEHFVAGQPFLDGFTPSPLRDTLYHHDGQIDEEVYVFGSFTQSKMFQAGVRCTDCHHPHTMKLILPGNALCVRCHQPDKYNTQAHHFHPPDTPGASCVECHMPTKNFMVTDARRDHSLRIPRPDLSDKLDSPNACNNCHTDQTTEWATKAFHEWWGKKQRPPHYGEILAAARQGFPGADERLRQLAEDFSRPDIVRATAVMELTRQAPSQANMQVILSRLEDEDPLVRYEALAGLEAVQPQQRVQLAAASLKDSSRAVRTEAARVLAASTAFMNAAQQADFAAASEEFVARQNAVADRAAGHFGLGLFYQSLGQPMKAEAAYRQGLEVQPDDLPCRINLAEMLYQQGKVAEADENFQRALESPIEPGVAHEAYARFLIRQKDYDKGTEHLRQAAELMPRNPGVQYFYGVALNSLGLFSEALPYLQKAASLAPTNPEYLAGIAAIARDAGEYQLALDYARRLEVIDRNNPQVQALIQDIQTRMPRGQ